MVLNSGFLDRRIQVQRVVTKTPDGLGGYSGSWEDVGEILYAKRVDVSDQEKLQAGSWQNCLVTRFTVRASNFARDIRHSDRIRHEGQVFNIDGIKEVPQTRAYLEITAISSGVA